MRSPRRARRGSPAIVIGEADDSSMSHNLNCAVVARQMRPRTARLATRTTDSTRSWWPDHTAGAGGGRCGSQIRRVPSSQPVASRAAVGRPRHRARAHLVLCPAEKRGLRPRARGGIPRFARSRRRPPHRWPAIDCRETIRSTGDQTGMTCQLQRCAYTERRVPDPHDSVGARRCELLTVWRPCHRPDAAVDVGQRHWGMHRACPAPTPRIGPSSLPVAAAAARSGDHETDQIHRINGVCHRPLSRSPGRWVPKPGRWRLSGAGGQSGSRPATRPADHTCQSWPSSTMCSAESSGSQT